MYYPLMLNIKDKKVVVFGGGSVAYRKAGKLLDYGASLTLVSPQCLDKFQDLDIEYIRDEYREEYLKDAFLVIGATSNREINAKIGRDCRARNILVNLVDDREASSFITPSIVDKEGVILAISTKGRYPALSKSIRKDLDSRFDRYDGAYMDLLEEIRQEILENHSSRKQELIEKALDMNIDQLKEYLIILKEE